MRPAAFLVVLASCTGAAPDGEGPDGLGEPAATTDVLVIGSGPAGLSAAHAVAEAGREVLIVERDAQPGGAGLYAGMFYAVDSRYMRGAGVADSVALAAEEWPAWAIGGDAQDPRVQLLFERSAETVEWLVEGLGVEMGPVLNEPGMAVLPRLHALPIGPDGPTARLIEALDDRIRLDAEVTDIVFDDAGRAHGAMIRDRATGAESWIRADAVVVGTGGFARDLDRVLQHRPELEGMQLLFEAGYGSDGGGHAVMERAGAVWQNEGAVGTYVHAAADPREGFAGEALWVQGLWFGVLLDAEGRRFVDETSTLGFDLAGLLAETPGRRAFAVLPRDVYMATPVMVPPYGLAPDEPEGIDPQLLVDWGVVRAFATPEALAAGLGMDPATVIDTFDRYERFVAEGHDEDHGKRGGSLVSFAGTDYVAFELHAGVAKGFTGFAVDVDGRVLDRSGAAVPGLYAGGEVTGMLGSPGVGDGFSGSITACYLTGLVAGERAAAELPE